MFRKMRRSAQQLSFEECTRILEECTSGVLALSGDDGYPYAVPLSYVYTGGKIFFHSAVEGHKTDAVKSDEKCSFCVIEKDFVVPSEFTTYFRSVIVFGRIRILEDKTEILRAIRSLADKYSPDETEADVSHTIDGALSRMTMLELTPEHISGKEALELVRK